MYENILNNQETTVVNCKVCYIRPFYQDLKHWCEDDRNVYIGRKGVVFVKTEHDKKERYPKKDSIFANPFKLKKNKKNNEDNREEILALYENYIIEKIIDEELYDDLRMLKGKRLGCWCKEKGSDIGCHGDILVKLLKRLEDTGSLS